MSAKQPKLSDFSEEQQIYLFNELFNKYHVSSESGQEESSDIKHESSSSSEKKRGRPKKVKPTTDETDEPPRTPKKRGMPKGVPKNPVDTKYKRDVDEGIPHKILAASISGKSHAQISEEFGRTKYMVGKLLRYAKENPPTKEVENVEEIKEAA